MYTKQNSSSTLLIIVLLTRSKTVQRNDILKKQFAFVSVKQMNFEVHQTLKKRRNHKSDLFVSQQYKNAAFLPTLNVALPFISPTISFIIDVLIMKQFCMTYQFWHDDFKEVLGILKLRI